MDYFKTVLISFILTAFAYAIPFDPNTYVSEFPEPNYVNLTYPEMLYMASDAQSMYDDIISSARQSIGLLDDDTASYEVSDELTLEQVRFFDFIVYYDRLRKYTLKYQLENNLLDEQLYKTALEELENNVMQSLIKAFGFPVTEND